jgi:hypothetical protein
MYLFARSFNFFMPSRIAVFEIILRSYTCRLLSLPQVKISLKRAVFSNSGKIQCAVTREVHNISKSDFLEGMKKFNPLTPN